ncbi:MAG: hypothetical protein AAGI89_01965 [Pseudomonadota bacterium]
MSTLQSGSERTAKRLHPFSLRLSDAEKAHLSRAAGPSRSMASYARAKLFGDDCDSKPVRIARSPSVDRALLAQALGRLGASNLSRDFAALAGAASSGALETTPELQAKLAAACDDLKAMRDELTGALGLKVRE